MKAKAADWYRKNWTLDIKNMSWVENSAREVDFILELCDLKPGARILDLACGYGRHALELAGRGYSVVGVDITPAYIEDAQSNVRRLGLDNAEFLCCDIREVAFREEFDLVLNLADGAIGYLESDEENLKIFDVVARALKRGGQHVCDLVCGDYADAHFPVKLWEAGAHAVSLSEFDWNPETRIMIFGNQDFPYGTPMTRPEIPEGDPTRVYTIGEIVEIMNRRGMTVRGAYAGYSSQAASAKSFQMLVHSQKL